MPKIEWTAWLPSDIFKGEDISSGFEGASAIKQFGDLTGKLPCELMHNDHITKWKNKVGLRKFSLKMAVESKEIVPSKKARIPTI